MKKELKVRIKVKGKMQWTSLERLEYGKTYYDTRGNKRIKKKPSEQTKQILKGIEETKEMRRVINKAKRTAKAMVKVGFATKDANVTLWELEHPYKVVKGKHNERLYETVIIKSTGKQVKVLRREVRTMQEQYKEAQRYLEQTLTKEWLGDPVGRREWENLKLNPKEWDTVWKMLERIGYDYEYFRDHPDSYDALQANINVATRILGRNDLQAIANEADRLTDNLLGMMNDGSDEIEF